VPFDKEEDFHFVATAYYLSPAVRAHWEKTLGGHIIWQATTMDIIADFLDRLTADRTDALKRNIGAVKSTTRPPFALGGSTPPVMPGGSRPPFPPGGSAAPIHPHRTRPPMSAP
jgi:hypothetical protein